MGNQLDIDFLSPAVIADPFAMHERVRAEGPVVWNGAMGGWMVTGYADCQEVLTDNGGRFGMLPATAEVLPWFEEQNMITSDGAAHTRLRGVLTLLLSHRAIAHWEQRVAEVVDELLAPLTTGTTSYDLIADFTMIPTIIVAEMLGVPAERHAEFRSWSHTITTNISWGKESPAARAAVLTAGTELNGYLREELDRHLRERPEDLLTSLLDAVDAGALSLEEVRSTAVLLLAAGYDTTAKLMSNALVAFESYPDQRRLVAEDLSLVPLAIEEVLRWAGTSQSTIRVATSDTVLAGTQIAAGDAVYVMLAAAGRDPSRWERPDEFDLLRERKNHLGLGYGVHMCLGAPLARLEVRVALERLLTLAPDFRLRDVGFGDAFFVHGPDRGKLDVPVRA